MFKKKLFYMSVYTHLVTLKKQIVHFSALHQATLNKMIVD